MQTLNKLMRKVIDNVNDVCNNSIPSIDVEKAAEHIDNYLAEAWWAATEEDPSWTLILNAFHNQYADETNDEVTFIAYIILTQCMLKDKKKS